MDTIVKIRNRSLKKIYFDLVLGGKFKSDPHEYGIKSMAKLWCFKDLEFFSIVRDHFYLTVF